MGSPGSKTSLSKQIKCFFFFFKFYFIFKLYITVLVLPNIKMNPPQVYMCSPEFSLKMFSVHLFIFLVPWVFVAVCRLSLVAVSEGYSSVAEQGLLTAVASLAVDHKR